MEVSAIREFNRFYVTRVGLLHQRYLGGELSLTESRLLYEIAAHPSTTASALRNLLGLDAGYVSRLLSGLKRRGLVHQKPSASDPREKLLALSAVGKRKVAQINEQSDEQMRQVLRDLNEADRHRLVQSLSTVRSILRPDPLGIRIERLKALSKEATALLREYYDAAEVVQRDGPVKVKEVVSDPASGLWLAYKGDELAGCVMLKARGSIGDCKRLYVRPSCRRSGIAEALMDALETFAKETSLEWLYLDTNDTMRAAVALYTRRGYVSCERFNDNPRANLFFRKPVMS